MAFSGVDLTVAQSILVLCAIVLGGVVCSGIFLWICRCCEGRAQRRLESDRERMIAELQRDEELHRTKTIPKYNSPSAPAQPQPSAPIHPRVLKNLRTVPEVENGIVREPEEVTHFTLGTSSSNAKKRSPSSAQLGTVSQSYESQFATSNEEVVMPNPTRTSLATIVSDSDEKVEMITEMNRTNMTMGVKVERINPTIERNVTESEV